MGATKIIFCYCKNKIIAEHYKKVIELVKQRFKDFNFCEADELCKALNKTRAIIENEKIKNVIICACDDDFVKEKIIKKLEDLHSFGIEYIKAIRKKELEFPFNNPKILSIEILKQLIRISDEDFSFYNLKPVFNFKNKLNRRELFHSLKVKYEIIPFIDLKKCKRGEGCRICFYLCEKKAIKVNEEILEISASECNACGKCAWECPAQAIIFPKFSRNKMEEIINLISEENSLPEPKVFIFHNRSKDNAINNKDEFYFTKIELPSLEVITPYLLLKCFYKGIEGIIIYDKNGATNKFLRMINFTKSLMNFLNIDSRRLVLIKEDRQIKDFIREIKRYRDIPKLNNREEFFNLRILLKTLKEKGEIKCNFISVSEFFNKIIIDESKCIFCEACIKVCPASALRVDRKENSSIIFNYSECIGCVECIKICPLKIIKLQKVFNLEEYLKEGEILVQSPEVYCKLCGKPYITEKSFSKLIKDLENHKGIEKYLRMCPECRLLSL